MIKILHGADFHLDSPFDSLPEKKAALRRAEQRQLIDDMVRLANSEKVDLVFLAGDLFDSERSYYETGDVLLRAMERIRAKIFIAPGNHDYYGSTTPYKVLKFPEHVHVFKTPEMEKVVLDGGECTVWGAAFTSGVSGPLLKNFPRLKEKGLNLMVLHGAVGEREERYNPISEDQIAATGIDYLALGHIHTYSGLKRAGGTAYAYPGCPQGRGFDETGEKGVIIAEIEKGYISHRFVPLCKRQYNVIQVDLTDAEDAKRAVLSVLPDVSEDIYKIILTGAYSEPIDLPGITDAAWKRCFHATVRDNTRLKRSLWSQAEEDTLKGLFLRKMRSRYDAGDEAEKRKIDLAIRFCLAAMENGEQWRT